MDGVLTPRVLHVAVPTTEGVAVVLLDYVREQVGRGWRVAVACPASGWLAAAASAAGAEVHVWSARRSPGPWVATEAARLGRIVSRVRPDVVHLHSSKAGLAGRLVLRGRVPTIFQPHAWSFHASRPALPWERYATRWTTHLVCVSDDELEKGRAAGIRGAATVVPNGVDLSRWRPADRRSARAELGLPDLPTVVCVGRLTEQKGQHDLLDAWPAVRAAVPDARLVLVGDGPDRASLESRRVAGVALVGARDDVPRWYAAADVVVVPSRWEGMALVPLEAMACGRSVVAAPVAGLPDGVATGPLDDALVARLRDPELAAAEGDAGRAVAERSHDRVSSVAAVAELARSLAPAAAR